MKDWILRAIDEFAVGVAVVVVLVGLTWVFGYFMTRSSSTHVAPTTTTVTVPVTTAPPTTVPAVHEDQVPITEQPATTTVTTTTTIPAPKAVGCPASGNVTYIHGDPDSTTHSYAWQQFDCGIAEYGTTWTPPAMTVTTSPVLSTPTTNEIHAAAPVSGSYAAWSKVATCEEGGWVGSAGYAYPDSLGITRANWFAFGGGSDVSSAAQIAVGERLIEHYYIGVPDQHGCQGSW